MRITRPWRRLSLHVRFGRFSNRHGRSPSIVGYRARKPLVVRRCVLQRPLRANNRGATGWSACIQRCERPRRRESGWPAAILNAAGEGRATSPVTTRRSGTHAGSPATNKFLVGSRDLPDTSRRRTPTTIRSRKNGRRFLSNPLRRDGRVLSWVTHIRICSTTPLPFHSTLWYIFEQSILGLCV